MQRQIDKLAERTPSLDAPAAKATAHAEAQVCAQRVDREVDIEPGARRAVSNRQIRAIVACHWGFDTRKVGLGRGGNVIGRRQAACPEVVGRQGPRRRPTRVGPVSVAKLHGEHEENIAGLMSKYEDKLKARGRIDNQLVFAADKGEQLRKLGLKIHERDTATDQYIDDCIWYEDCVKRTGLGIGHFTTTTTLTGVPVAGAVKGL